METTLIALKLIVILLLLADNVLSAARKPQPTVLDAS